MLAAKRRIPMQDRRKTARRRTYFGGQIEFNQHSSLMDCVVRNVSQDGAKLVFTNTAAVPQEFSLAIPRQNRIFRARMIWRKANEAGVALDRKSTRLNSSHANISYAVFCLKK